MSRPYFFTWVDEPLVAACAEPNAPEQLAWLRGEGVDILVTLTEEPLPRSWIDGAGLMSVHVPVADMDSPTLEQIEQVLGVIDKAKSSNMGVAVHCMAGRGRTGTLLAAYFVHQGLSAREAIRKVRQLRPGSIEVTEQEDVVLEFERRRRKS
jgi:atypical dual specificity phosphatase